MEWFAWFAVSLVLFLLLFAAGCDYQYRMLYYPDPSRPSQESLASRDMKTWPGGEKYRGFVGGAESGRAKGTIVVFHGNGGTAFDRDYYLKAFGRLGYRVILAEYPQYGGRNGKLGEASFVNDGIETLRLAYAMYGGPIYLLGESLGCGVVSAVVAARPAPVAGIVLITPWDTLRSVAQHHFRIMPVGLFLKDSYDNVANLVTYEGRIAVVGAERDSIIPISHARNLFDSLPGSDRRMWVVEQAGHNDWLMRVEQDWWREIADFISGGGKRETDTPGERR